MPLLSRKRTLLVKKENTYGSDSSPAGTDAVLVRNLEITPLEADTVSRDLIRPYLGNSEQLLANTRVGITFQVELAGSGAAGTAPRYGALLQACGMSETIDTGVSVTYDPVSASFSSATIYFNNDGILHKATGCRGTFSLNCNLNEIPTIDFTMTGVYNAPTDTAAPSTTYTNQATPLIFKAGNTSAFSFHSYSGCLMNVSFDMANEVIHRELIGCTKQVLITNRAPAGTVVIEAPTLATKNYFTIAGSDSTGNLTFQHGTTAGNVVTFTAGKTDIGQPTYSDSNGIQMLNLPYVAVPDTGNDEVELVFT